MSNYIAERKLFFTEKGSSVKNELYIRLMAPTSIQPDTVKFPVNEDMAVCHVEFEGLNEHSFDVYGMDSLQAINLASNVESVIKRLSSKYDFFWSSGDPYFEDEG